MAKALIKVDVRSRATLLEMLRTQQEQRRVHGERSFSFCVNDDARHIGYIILEWESFRSVRKFVDSSFSRELIAEWPVVEVFEVLALRDIADDYDA